MTDAFADKEVGWIKARLVLLKEQRDTESAKRKRLNVRLDWLNLQVNATKEWLKEVTETPTN